MIEPGMRMPPADAKLEVTEKYTEAVNLNAQIHLSAQAAQQNLYDMCMGFKKMRDSKLYKELGYSDFGEYCEKEVGFERRNVYRYISIIENLPENFVTSMSQIGFTKLNLLSTLSDEERTQIVESTNLENTTVRELKEQISELKQKADKADMLSHRLDDMNDNCSRISEQRDKAELQVRKLEEQIKELENRPVEVAVADNSEELKKLKEELESEKQQALKEAKKAADEQISQLQEQINDTKAKLKEKSETTKVDEEKIQFKDLYTFTFDALKRLVEFTNQSNNKIYASKVNELLEAIKNNIRD